jgi:hypothetical protein
VSFAAARRKHRATASASATPDGSDRSCHNGNGLFPFSEKFQRFVEGEMSTPRDIQAGVPQGSVLSCPVPHIVQYTYK